MKKILIVLLLVMYSVQPQTWRVTPTTALGATGVGFGLGYYLCHSQVSQLQNKLRLLQEQLQDQESLNEKLSLLSRNNLVYESLLQELQQENNQLRQENNKLLLQMEGLTYQKGE